MNHKHAAPAVTLLATVVASVKVPGGSIQPLLDINAVAPPSEQIAIKKPESSVAAAPVLSKRAPERTPSSPYVNFFV